MLEKPAVDQYLELAGMHDPALRQHVYEITHGHALCVSIVGAFYQESEQQLLSDVDASVLQKEFDERASIEFINERILNNLKNPFRDLTQYGVLLRSFNLPLLKAVFPELLPEQAALSRFEQLIRYPYIESLGNYRYAFHELIREVLAKKTQRDHPEEWKTYHKNALDHFTPGLGMPQASDRSAEWYYHALAYYIACDKEEEGMAHWRQAVQEAHIGRTRKDAGSLLQVAYDQTLKLSPAACAERDFEQGRFHYYSQRWEAALKSYTQAFGFFEQVKDRQRQATTSRAMGDVQRAQGKLDAALRNYKEARAFYEAVEDRLGQAKVLQAMGSVQQSRNELETALYSYEQAFHLFGQERDRLGQADVRRAMGDVQRALDQKEAALQSYGQAIALYEEVGSERGKIEAEQAKNELYAFYVIATPADEEFVSRLKSDLQARGITIWTGREAAELGTLAWTETLRRMMRTAASVLLIASPNTRRSRNVKDELRVAEIYQRPVYAVWMAGTQWMDAAPLGWGGVQYIDARDAHYETALREIATLLRKALITSLKTPDLDFEPRNPYKGLRAFTQQDASDFFGREQLVRELVEAVVEAVKEGLASEWSARLLAVIGPSGSGKSSVVMAGLLPQLQQGAIPGSEDWVYLEPMVPGKHPIEALALTLKPHFPDTSFKTLREDLEDDATRGLHVLATQLVKRRGMSVVLLVDQFEELFTQTEDEDERRRFIELLLTAVTEPRGPLLALLTLRADFYDRPLFYPELGRLIQKYSSLILPMDVNDLRSAIEKPAALPDVELMLEGDLIGDLLFEMQGQVGALPLLQFTLEQLFERRSGHSLTLSAYREIDGVKGALSQHAEKTYTALSSDEHRHLARALFLRLIDVGTAEQDVTRRRAALSEFSLADATTTRLLRETADAFIAARLLTTNEVAGTITIEVSHEALIREWGRLATWLQEAHEDIHLQQVISKDAAEWERRNKPGDRLYRGSQLIEAQAWAERNVPSADEVAFLQASAAERQRQEQAELDQRARELTLQRRVVSRQRLLLTALSIFLVVAITLASLAGNGFLQAVSQRELAVQQVQFALSRALAANASFSLSQNELDRALLLSVKATQVANTFEARNSLLSALEQSPHIVTVLRGESTAVTTLAFSPDDRTLVSSDVYGVYIWDTLTKEGHPFRFDSRVTEIGSVALSPNLRTLVTSSAEGVWLWDIQTGAPIAQLEGPIGNAPANFIPHSSIAFSSDGNLVVSGRCARYSFNQDIPRCLESQVFTWDVLSKKPIGSPYLVDADVSNLAFSPDGKTLAVGSGTSIQLLNTVTSQPLGPPLIANGDVNSLAFSPNGKTLAAGSKDITLRLWDVASRQAIGSRGGHTDSITSVAFSPDGKILATGSLDKTVIFWDVASRDPKGSTLTGDTQPKTSIAFSPDGRTLASGSADGTIILWNLDAESPISQWQGDTGGLRSAVFSPNGTILFTGSDDGKIFLYDMKTNKTLQPLDTVALYPPRKLKPGEQEDLSAIQSLVLSKNGETLASGRRDGTILLWDMKTGTLLAQFHQTNLLQKIALSSDGQILVSVDNGDIITPWNVAKRTAFRSLPPHTQYQLSAPSIALSPDGKMLAAGGCEKVNNDGSCGQGQLLLWDVGNGKLISQPLLHSSEILDVAFSPDGQTLASSSRDGILLWDVPTRQVDGKALSLLANVRDYDHILFSPNGKLLASYSSPGPPFSFVLWDLTQQEPLANAIQEASSQGSIAFSPNGQQLASVNEDPSNNKDIVTLWDITIGLWQKHACTIANRNLTQDEWQQFLGDEAYSKVCPNLPL